MGEIKFVQQVADDFGVAVVECDLGDFVADIRAVVGVWNNENFAPNVTNAPMDVGKCFAKQPCMGLPAYAMHLVPLEAALVSSHMLYNKLQTLETFA